MVGSTTYANTVASTSNRLVQDGCDVIVQLDTFAGSESHNIRLVGVDLCDLSASSFLFTYLAMPLAQARVSPPIAGAILGVLCFGAAFLALATMEETFGKDLDYQEKK